MTFPNDNFQCTKRKGDILTGKRMFRCIANLYAGQFRAYDDDLWTVVVASVKTSGTPTACWIFMEEY
jgi:hypothetical protein